jgi:hypothetical protein
MPLNSFLLLYQGSFHANAGVLEKHRIRLALHAQLKQLWTLPSGPVDAEMAAHLEDPRNVLSSAKVHNGKSYVPIITPRQRVVCDLDVSFCLPRRKGHKFDIDNAWRLIFDTLRPPDSPTEPVPAIDDIHIYCLLSDDEHIHRVTAEYFPLLLDTDPLIVLRVTAMPQVGLSDSFELT